jgi:hypothetical protein
MRISVDEARDYFAHPSQQLMMVPEDLPEGLEYWADGPICGVFHLALWPGVWMAHYGVKPEGWGRLDAHAKAILSEFWDAMSPVRIIGWTDSKNRRAVSFARRIGFVVDGRMPVPDGEIVMQGWSK